MDGWMDGWMEENTMFPFIERMSGVLKVKVLSIIFFQHCIQ